MLTLILGALVGFVLGVTGAGGGILAIPALTLGLGWSPLLAAPVALLAVGSAALVGAVDGLRRGLVRYKAATLMALTGSLVAPVGLYAAGRLPAHWLPVLFSAVLMFVAVRLFRQGRASGSNGAGDDPLGSNCMLDPATGRLDWTARCSTTLVGIGAASGLLTGLLSVGGGFLIVPAFQRLSDVRMQGVVATSLMVVALVSLGTLGQLLYRGVEVPPQGLPFILATLAGMLGGRWLAPRLPAQVMRRSFALLCAGVSVAMLGKVLIGA